MHLIAFVRNQTKKERYNSIIPKIKNKRLDLTILTIYKMKQKIVKEKNLSFLMETLWDGRIRTSE